MAETQSASLAASSIKAASTPKPAAAPARNAAAGLKLDESAATVDKASQDSSQSNSPRLDQSSQVDTSQKEINFDQISSSRSMSLQAASFNESSRSRSAEVESTDVETLKVEQLTFAGVDMDDPEAVLQRAQAIKSVLRSQGGTDIEALKRAREVSQIESEARQALGGTIEVDSAAMAEIFDEQNAAGEISSTQVLAAIRDVQQTSEAVLSADSLDGSVQQDIASATRIVGSENEAAEEKSQLLAVAQNNRAALLFAGKELTVASLPFNELQVSIQRLVGSAQDSNLTPFFTVA